MSGIPMSAAPSTPDKQLAEKMLFGLVAETPSDPSERVRITEPTITIERVTQRKETYRLSDQIPELKSKQKTVSTFFGTFRTFATIDKWEWVYFTLSILSLVGSLGLTIERIIYLRHDIQNPEENKDSKADFTFALLLLWTTLVCFYHVGAGILCERPYDLLVFVATTIIVLLYVIMNYIASTERQIIKEVRLILTAVIGPVIIGGGLYYSRRYIVSGNLIFNTVGANAEMQKICKQVFLTVSLLTLDGQLGGSALILWLQKSFISTHVDLLEMWVLGVGTVITTIWTALGFFGIQREINSLIYLFFATSVIEPALIVYNLVRTSRIGPNDAVKSLLYSTYACGIAALLVRVGVVYSMYIVMNNFGKGLRDKIFGGTSKQEVESNTVDD